MILMQSSCCYFDPSLDPPSLICGTWPKRLLVPSLDPEELHPKREQFWRVYVCLCYLMLFNVIYIIHFRKFWGLLKLIGFIMVDQMFITFDLVFISYQTFESQRMFDDFSTFFDFCLLTVFLCLFEGSTFAFFPQRSSCWNELSCNATQPWILC